MLTKNQKKTWGVWVNHDVDEIRLQVDGWFKAFWYISEDVLYNTGIVYENYDSGIKEDKKELRYTMVSKGRQAWFNFDLDGIHYMRDGSASRTCYTSKSMTEI